MKKIFYAIDIPLLLAILVSVVLNQFLSLCWLTTTINILVCVIAALHVLYVFNFQERKTGLSSVLFFVAILLSIIANLFIVKNVVLFFILLSVGVVALMGATIINSKFSYWSFAYILAVSVPFVLFVNISPMFGFSGIGNRILISIFASLTSGLFGLAVAQLFKKKNAFNTTFVIMTFLNLIMALGLIILKQSNVTHKIEPIITFVFYIMMLFVCVLMLMLTNNGKQVQTNTQKHVVSFVNIFLVVGIICYAIASSFMAFNFVSAKIFKNQFLSMVENNLNIPVVEIATQDNILPYSKEEYVNCSFEISNCENEDYNFNVPMAKNYEDDGCVGIRLRGNSTKKARKRPYRIKFDEKQSLFGLKANKSWVLLADYYDQSYIRNYAAFTLADEFDNLDFSPTPHHVALIINNEFKGLYLLCEQMDEKKGRVNVDEDFDVNIDKDFPFFVEMDLFAYKEGKTGVDNFYVESVDNHVEIKYPEADERSATEDVDIVYDYINEYINAVFTTLKTNEKVEVSFRDTPVGLEDLVDIDSAVDYYLVNEIMMNIDSAFKSIYLHKPKDGKMKFGPVWDFDFSMTSELVAPYKKSYSEHTNSLWITQNSPIYQGLFQNESFYHAVATRFNDKKEAILKTCEELKNYKETIDAVALIDAKMWHGTTGEFQYDMQYDYVRLFLMDRYDFLDSVFSKSHAEFLKFAVKCWWK